MLLGLDFIFGLMVLAAGFAIEVLGWKIHQQIVSVSGLVVGLVVGDFIWSQVLLLDLLIWKVLFLSIFSVAFTILFFVYMRFSISITCGIVGSLIVSGFTSSRTLIDWNLNYLIFKTNYNYAALIISFIISSYAGYRFFKLGYIILSTGIGSVLISYGGVISGLWGNDQLGIFLLLSLLLGMIIQLSQEGSIRESRLRMKTLQYCSKCGSNIELNAKICPKCGYEVVQNEI